MMSAPPLALAPTIDEAEVRRYMGYPRGRLPSGRLAARWDALIGEAAQALAAQGCYRLVDGDALQKAGMPRPSERVAIGLVTIGRALEARISAYGRKGDRVAAMVLDACGSAAVEAAADLLDCEIRTLCAREGLNVQRRISPGYGRWDVRGQGALLALLPSAELGVTLTPGMMMVPRKSISFAMRVLLPDEAAEREPSACQVCELLRCPYAKERGEVNET